jgi:hypothetical protein
VFLKEPQAIASQNWASLILSRKATMENLNMMEETDAANALTSDQLDCLVSGNEAKIATERLDECFFRILSTILSVTISLLTMR